jgi:hypothetical protein
MMIALEKESNRFKPFSYSNLAKSISIYETFKELGA